MCVYIYIYIYIVYIQFVKEGNILKISHRNRHNNFTDWCVDGFTDWCVIADVDQQLTFSIEIISTHQRPDLVIWSVNSKKVIIAELTKLGKYEYLHEQCIMNGWSTDIFPLEIGCRGFISNSTSTFLTKPAEKREYIKNIQNKTLTASERIWHSYQSNAIQ